MCGVMFNSLPRAFLSSADFEKFFQEYHQSVRPDLGPNWLQRLSADDTRQEKS